jgi:DNA-binding GntR family transcriptional regulator
MTIRTKEEQVAEFLREGIIAGRFARGERLKQLEIAALLDISATPVREALRLLEAEGYVLSTSHRGVVVAPFDVAASNEIVELRVLLEGRLALAAMERIERADLDALLASHALFLSAVDGGKRQEIRASNYQFHRELYSFAEQPQTWRFVQMLWAKYPFDLINLIGGRPGRAGSEHSHILEGMLAGDRIAVAAAVRQHVMYGWQELQTALESGTISATGAIDACNGDVLQGEVTEA